MDRTTLLWMLVIFFGASLVFAYVRRATEDLGAGATLGIQFGVGLAIVGVIVLVFRHRL